ncbi:hypothetical protein BD408DRAFT_438583 [Parasitella parasitica]|nr:hypothetical protein BD408DRAFT_438583 [Parasitella parasitica]
MSTPNSQSGSASHIATAGSTPAAEVDPWVEDLKVKTARLKELRELVGLTGSVLSVPVSSSAGSSVAGGSMFLVPGGLPYFQWEGTVSDSKLTVLRIWMCHEPVESSSPNNYTS